MTISPSRTRPNIDPRMKARRVAVTRERGRHRLRFVVAGAVLVLLGVLALAVLHTSIFSARHLKVLGAVHTPPSTVLAVAGLAGHPPMIDVDAGLSSEKIERLAWIDKASVEVRWPDSVTVVVTERVPTATLPAAGGGLAVVDGSGRVLAHLSQPPAGTVALGVPARAGPPGSVIAGQDSSALGVARGLPAALTAQVRSVDAEPGGQVGLTLAGGQQVHLGAPDQLAEKFEALESLLAANVLNGAASVDLTVPDEPIVSPVTPG